MLAVRASVVVELLAAATALVLIASSPTRPTHAFAMPTPPRIEIPSPVEIDPCATLPAAYRESHFRAAVRALPATCKAASELLGKLADEWAIGMNRRGDPDERFEALEQARRHDLALGGAHADAIDDAMRTVVVRAAISYLAAHQSHDAANAVATARLLGVHDHMLLSIERRIAQQCIEGPPEYCD